MKIYTPKYIQSFKSGRLKDSIEILTKRMNHCDLCPRNCKINRLKGEKGICNTGKYAKLASYGPHFGEEAPLAGKFGSGTIFFSNCNLLCNFCQNFDISHEGRGVEVNDEQLSDIMISLQDTGCHNINFVTPSHVILQILKALIIAIEKGLNIPLIYNTSAYDNIETIKLLDGIIDIYMPDLKFWNSKVAELTCNATDYVENAKSSILEMYRQTGKLLINEKGIAVKGLLIRHLVMPHNFSGTEQVLDFISDKISPETYVNIMPQYRPEGKAFMIKKISKSLDYSDYVKAKKYADNIGLVNLVSVTK